MDNRLGIKRFGPITFFVRNAVEEVERLTKMFGMELAYIHTDSKPVFGIEGGDVLFIIDGTPNAVKAAERFGNHVAEIGLRVVDSSLALEAARKVTNQPTRVCSATGASYLRAPHDGEIDFKFIQDDQTPYPGLVRNPNRVSGAKAAFKRIDHIVVNTQLIAPVVSFMRDVFGMSKVNEFTIKVTNEDFTASLYSEVMGIYGTEHPVLFPLNEPLPDDPNSQIPAQLREVGRSHAQHIALLTDSIIDSIATLRERGLAFLDFRNAQHAECYYRDVPNRLGKIPVKEAMDRLRSEGILVDKCGAGYLLQLFSKRLFPDKSVPFVEIIQRASDVIGCFGDGNFAALAEALEHSMRQEGVA